MGFRLVEFADGAAFIGSGCVEVAETYVTESVGAGIGLERVLERQFCGSVGIHWVARGVFGDWNFVGYAVNGACGREDELFNFCFDHRIEQTDSG